MLRRLFFTGEYDINRQKNKEFVIQMGIFAAIHLLWLCNFYRCSMLLHATLITFF